MNDKNFDFSKTREALSQLSTDIIELESVIKIKCSQTEKQNAELLENLAKKEQTVSDLTKASKNALEKIETITKFIDEVL